MRTIGTQTTGIRAPIINQGDYIAGIVVDSIAAAVDSGDIKLRDNDIIAFTESIVARSQGNYVTVDDIAKEVQQKLGRKHITVMFPIFSRNRFSMILKGVARACEEVTVVLQAPRDEVGNIIGKHPFTGVDYAELYQDIIEEEGALAHISQHWDSELLVAPTTPTLVADIHTRHNTYQLLKTDDPRQKLAMLTDLCNGVTTAHGYNIEWGLLGSNKAGEETLKLFPRTYDKLGDNYVDEVQAMLHDQYNVDVEVIIYGDGAFKCPVSKVWELADPVVGVDYTDRLGTTPNELKMKYMADTVLRDKEDKEEAMRELIRDKPKTLVADMRSQGTTPRQFSDLVGSLCDLTSGSGDKGTPIVHISGYFDNYASE